MKKIWYIAGLVIIIVLAGALYLLSRKKSPEPAAAPVNNNEQAQKNEPENLPLNVAQMTFFVTSSNPGRGADLGGLAGADNYCQTLANSVGAGNRTWRAYLSTMPAGNSPAINARDRIGNGPWHNIQGVLIANNLDELHNGNNINKQTALTEKGTVVNGRGDSPNLHDILTGSGMDGRAIPGTADSTCGNWTKSGDGAAMVGHHDRVGLADDAPSKSWNSSHLSRGCSNEALASSGGGGLFYCFAASPSTPPANQPTATTPQTVNDDSVRDGGPFATPTDRRRGADKPED